MTNHFEQSWRHYQDRVEIVLDGVLKNRDDVVPDALIEPMRYVTLGGGKRLRALLVYSAGELGGATPEQLDIPAAAVELIHAYSLTHDDLPCMDDDELRRGKPTCHIAFDEATAVLTGDALQTLAFSLLSAPTLNLPSSCAVQMIALLAEASGPAGMVGGQVLDMQAVDCAISLEQLQRMHRLKTGALITASVLMGGIAAMAQEETRLPASPHGFADRFDALREYGDSIGLAFQIADDILDVTKNSEVLGKPAGSDGKMRKSTYVSLLGLSDSRGQAEKLSGRAVEVIRGLGGDTELLEHLARFVVSRSY